MGANLHSIKQNCWFIKDHREKRFFPFSMERKISSSNDVVFRDLWIFRLNRLCCLRNISILRIKRDYMETAKQQNRQNVYVFRLFCPFSFEQQRLPGHLPRGCLQLGFKISFLGSIIIFPIFSLSAKSNPLSTELAEKVPFYSKSRLRSLTSTKGC